MAPDAAAQGWRPIRPTAPPGPVGDDDAVSAYPVPVPVDPTDVAWKRVGAAVIDVGIGAVVSLVLFLVLSESTYRYDRFANRVSYTRELTGAGAVLFYGWWLAYNVGVFVLQRGITGRTLGTMALGIKTVDTQGAPPGPAVALLRSVAGVVDYLPCCIPLVGLITIFTTPGHRRVGDMAAKTLVVDARAAAPAASTPVPPTMPSTSAPPQAFPGGPPTAAPTPPPKLPPVLPTGATATPFAPGPAGWAPTSPPSRPGPVPQWDPERRAYIAWDPDRQQWLQFDQPSQQWLHYDAVTRQWRPVT